MMQRCLNMNSLAYRHYGVRGIAICDRWLNSFENFLEDMGPKPDPKLTLERIKNDGNYEPGNCKWATKKEQAHNTRTVQKARINRMWGEELPKPKRYESNGAVMKDLFDFELRQQKVICASCDIPFMRRRTNHRYCCEKCRIRVFYRHVRAEQKAIDAKIDALMKRM